jgi:flavin-dependent dehydrogenase
LIIIGAGPAGISTALHLMQIDPSWAERMVVVEKARHPRPKLCGGGLTRMGLEVLRDLGFPLPLPLPQARVDDVRLQYRNRVVHVRGNPQIAIFHRPELDAWLAEQAQERGVHIQQMVAVKTLARDAEGVTIQTNTEEFRAKVVVGADGSLGITRRLVEGGRTRKRIARLLETILPADQQAGQFTERYALFDFTALDHDLQGYFWDFPMLAGGVPGFNRGVYDARLAAKRRRADLPGLLGAGIQGLGPLQTGSQVAGHPLHWFSPRNRLAAERVLLVGDAAGADPLFGEGIAPALGYGLVAAQVVNNAFLRQDFSFRDYRRQVFRSKVGRYLLLRWLVAESSYRLSMHAWFVHLVWSLGGLLNRLWPIPADLYGE